MELKEELDSQVPERTDTREALGNQGPEATGQSFGGTLVTLIKPQFILVKTLIPGTDSVIGWAETAVGSTLIDRSNGRDALSKKKKITLLL